jgi:hypothetical protein
VLNTWGAPENRTDGTFRIPMNMDYQSKPPGVNWLNLNAGIYFVEFGGDSTPKTSS